MTPGVKRVSASLLCYAERRLDRLPKAVALRRSEYGRAVAFALEALLPRRSAVERDAILRGVVRHRLLNRTIEFLQGAVPSLAVAVARFVPVVAEPGAAAAIGDAAAPVIITSGHFGPLFFQALVLRRFLRQRRVIIVLRERALYLRKIEPFVRRLGYEPLLDDRYLLLKLRRALRDDPRAVVMIVFDHTQQGRHIVPFLGGAVMTSNGMGLLADIGATSVVSSFWQWNRGRPRIAIEGPYRVDRSLPPAQRRRRLLNVLYAILERKIAAAPEQWSGWFYIAPRLTVAAPLEPPLESLS